MKTALLTALFMGCTFVNISGSSENNPDLTNRSVIPDSLKASLNPKNTKSFFEKSLIASKALGAGVVGTFLLVNTIYSGDKNLRNFLNPNLSSFLRLGGVSLVALSLYLTAETTHYSLRSFQDLM